MGTSRFRNRVVLRGPAGSAGIGRATGRPRSLEGGQGRAVTYRTDAAGADATLARTEGRRPGHREFQGWIWPAPAGIQ